MPTSTGLFAAIAARVVSRGTRSDANDLRLSALVELLYGSGLRATELVSLPRRAVAPDRPYLILRGKGGKERLVPLSDRARAAVAVVAGVRRGGQPVAVSLGQGASQPYPVVPVAQGPGGGGGYSTGPGQSARSAPRVRNASAGGRCRSSRVAGYARSCGHRYDRNLHACRCEPSRRAGQRTASAGGRDSGALTRRHAWGLTAARLWQPSSTSKNRSPNSRARSMNCGTPLRTAPST